MARSTPVVAAAFALLTAASFTLADAPQVRTYGQSVIAITFAPSFDIASGDNCESYRLSSADRGTIGIKEVGRDSKVQKYSGKGWPKTPVMQHTVFLKLDKPLEPGVDYSLAVAPAVTGEALTLGVEFDQANLAADLIKINQCGYLPGERKLAYLGGFLGDKGPMHLDGLSGKFSVLDTDTGKVAFEGAAALSKAADADSGEDVYWLDFTAFDTAGKYVLQVEGIGRSYPFVVSKDALEPALITLARGLYHQRCGIALTEPYTCWTHGVCHKTPAKLVTFHNSNDDIMKSLPQKVDPSGRTIDAWGGWHDAGDYDRLGHRHLETINDLLEAYEANPTRFVDRQFNIPESGNGIPDILDEAKWGLDWFERMFDPTDGGFYYRLETPNYGRGMPDQDNQQIYCMTKYPFYSTWSGVPFARAARIYRPFDAKLADHYLDIAKKALQFGQAELKKGDDADRIEKAIAWLAAELYVTTGDDAYQQIFLGCKARNSLWYAVCDRPGINAEARQAAREAFVSEAETLLARQHKHGYVTCFPGGSGGDMAVWESATLLRGYLVSGRKEFRDAALLTLDHHLGANPLGYAWITGVGQHYPKSILQIPSESDAIDEPVPGIPVFGPRAMDPEKSSTHGKLFAKSLCPDAATYPYLRSYSEIPEIVAFSEFVIKTQSSAIFSYSFFAPELAKK